MLISCDPIIVSIEYSISEFIRHLRRMLSIWVLFVENYTNFLEVNRVQGIVDSTGLFGLQHFGRVCFHEITSTVIFVDSTTFSSIVCS